MFVLCIVVAPKGEFQYTFRPCPVVGKEEREEERKIEEEKRVENLISFVQFRI